MPVTQLQVVSIPVSDQDRAKSFYLDTLGFRLVSDEPMGPDQRWLQLAPPGGGASITLVTWFETMSPGSVKGLVLGCTKIQATYDELAARGVQFSGAIEGHSQALFCSAFDPTHGGTYVALESFDGQVDGHHGTFSFAHAATTGADGERTDGWFTIVAGSGTGELTGIHGKGDIVIDANGAHHLNLTYELG